MNEKKKFCFLVVCIVVFAVVFFVCGIFFHSCFSGTEERAFEYEKRSTDVEELAERTEQRASEVAEQVRNAGSSIKSGITGIGELKQEYNRITVNGAEIAAGIAELESGISRCLQIIEKTEKKNVSLANDCDCDERCCINGRNDSFVE